MAEDLGERTEEATPKRRTEARESGNVAQSHDLASGLLLLAVTLMLWRAMTTLLGGFKQMVGNLLDGDLVTDPLDADQTMTSIWYALKMAVMAAGPVLLIAWLVAALAHFIQVGWLFAPSLLQPRMSKLNPMNGLRRIFGLQGAVKSLMDSGKVAAVIVVAVILVWPMLGDVISLPYLDMMQAAARAGEMMFDLAVAIALTLLVLGLIDWWYQRWRHTRDLRMSKQQVKDELRQAEGDPEVKRRQMRLRQQIAMQRISTAVPKADVIVTNPEHISVAIQYDAAKMNAPKVVAKGADYLALRIRQIAMRHGIPIVERKPLARALYAQVQVNQEVPPDFYQAVAEILAYVYRLSGRTAA